MIFKKSMDYLDLSNGADALLNTKPFVFSNNQRVGGYPIFLNKAEAQFIWDIDGNKFIDFLLGFGSIILGHSDNSVNIEVIKSIQKYGANPGLYTPVQIELAKKIVALVPGVEIVSFLKTGSDATNAAIRLARAITGRKLIIKWGMNGWHDWCCDWSPGVLDTSKRETITVKYNDLHQVEILFKNNPRQIACIILMPYEIEMPQEGYLEGLRLLCSKYDALLIFDEVRSGFRISMGGAQEYFNIQADLVTFGKALANGFEISVLAGKKQYMDRLINVGMTTTYYKNPMAISAALATLGCIEKRQAIKNIYNLGTMLKVGFDQLSSLTGVPIESVGHPSTPFIKFNFKNRDKNEKYIVNFCNRMLKKGVLMPSNHHWFICNAMTTKDITYTVNMAESVLQDMSKTSF